MDTVERCVPLPEQSPCAGSEEGLYLEAIIDLVQEKTGLRLHDYRRSALARRLSNRVKLARCRDYPEYLDLLKGSPDEAERLVQYVTIKWSRFFRDERVFERLRARVLPDIISRGMGEISVWSAGCARGEEPYSVAMALCEMSALGRKIDAFILGTDIDDNALAEARKRVFPPTSLDGVAKKRIDLYFEIESGRLGPTYRLCPDMAAGVHFQRHDLLSEEAPPQGRTFDLVLCRNVVIYFERRAQGRVFDLLLSSLAPGGYLCLGEAEQLPPSHARFFETVDRRDRVFRKR